MKNLEDSEKFKNGSRKNGDDNSEKNEKSEKTSLKNSIKSVFIVSSLILLFFLIIVTIIVFKNVTRNFSKEVEVYSTIFDEMIKLSSMTIKTICEDYSQWDDMYDYVLTGNKTFEEKYLNLEYLKKFGVEFIVVYSLNEPLFVETNNPAFQYVLSNFDPSAYVKKGKGLHCFEIDEALQFPLELFVYPIVKSDDYDRIKHVGYLLLGRYYDIHEILLLEKMTASVVTFENADLQKKANKTKVAGFLSFKKPLLNRKGEVIGYINGHRISETFRSVLTNIIILLVMSPLAFFGLVSIVAPFIAKRIVLPLRDIEYGIQNSTSDPFERYIHQKDEIGNLSRVIKSYLIQKEQINLYLKELESKNVSLRTLNEEIRKLLENDILTGLLTRRIFNEQIERLYVSSKADRVPLSAIAIDADDFKKVNDTYGHAVGDEVLKTIGEVILKNVRLSDFPIRMGGEEILILLPQADVNAAYSIAERIRKKIEETFKDKPFKVTVSLGVTQLKGEDSIETFLRRADDALYISKSSGKNKTTIL